MKFSEQKIQKKRHNYNFIKEKKKERKIQTNNLCVNIYKSDLTKIACGQSVRIICELQTCIH